MCRMRTIIERRRSVKQWSFLVRRSCCMKTSCGLVWKLHCPLKQRFTPVNLDTVNWDLIRDSQCWTRITHTLWWYTMWHSTTHSTTTSVLKTAALEEYVTIISLLKVSSRTNDSQRLYMSLLSFLTLDLYSFSQPNNPCQNYTRS